jgi:hypothetical protein
MRETPMSVASPRPAPTDPSSSPRLGRALSTAHCFTFGSATMVGVDWLVLIDDWLGLSAGSCS